MKDIVDYPIATIDRNRSLTNEYDNTREQLVHVVLTIGSSPIDEDSNVAKHRKAFVEHVDCDVQ
jgi:hypothetical protein